MAMVGLCRFHSHSCDKMPVKDDLKKAEFVWARGLSVHSTMVGETRGVCTLPWWGRPEAGV